MLVTVQFNGVLRQLAGDFTTIEVETPATAQAVLEVLARTIPGLSAHLARTACAVGDEIISRQCSLVPGEQLVLIPPVSGG